MAEKQRRLTKAEQKELVTAVSSFLDDDGTKKFTDREIAEQLASEGMFPGRRVTRTDVLGARVKHMLRSPRSARLERERLERHDPTLKR